MKYYFTTLATGEFYFENSVKSFIELSDRTEECYLNITTTAEDLANLEQFTELTKEDFQVKYPRINFTTIESFNFRIPCPLQQEGYGFTYNVNLKVLAIKACLKQFQDFEYVIYLDGDWNVYDGFQESKFMRLFREMEDDEIEFAFERPARIGDDRGKPETSFYRDKIYDYDIADNPLWDEAHVANEQFFVLKNNWKLKVFVQKWEQMMWYSIANGIRNYAEGFEMGISALEATMKWSWRMLPILNECFSFYTKWTNIHYTKF